MLQSIGGRRRIGFEFDLIDRVRAVIARLAEIRQMAEGRRAIARMDARMLSDIGLSRSEAVAEANRRPWDTVQRH